jgi:DNA replication protein DnaC
VPISLGRQTTQTAQQRQRLRSPFSEWGSIIKDPRLVAAIVDRLTFHAHIIETGTESYRLRTTRATRGRKKTA